MNGAEIVVTLLDAAGVEVVFGLCGDTSLPLYDALATMDHGIRHVLTRDERSASFMADAYARLSGRVGVCEGPSGGGATYILPGVAEANQSSVPLLCLTTDISLDDVGRGTLTELDQSALFAPVTRLTRTPRSPAEVAEAIRDALHAATTGPMGAAHVRLAYDTQTGSAEEGRSGGSGGSGGSGRSGGSGASKDLQVNPALGYGPSERLQPAPGEIDAAVALLVEARRPLVVCGAGAMRSGAWDETTMLAELLGAPVATSIGGKGVIAETHPYALGVIGSNGGLPYRHDMLRESDLILYVGSRQGSVTTEKWTLPADGEKTIVQLDVDPDRIGRNYRTAAGIVADAKLGVAALVDRLGDRLGGRPAARIDPDEIERRREAYMATIGEFTSDARPIRPERFVAALSAALAPGAVVIADPGTPCPYLSAYYRLPQAGRWFVSPRAHGALGYALPAVVGAHFARPDASAVVGVMGDGSFGISAGELETIARLGLPVTLIVMNNGGYGWIKAGQKQLGERYYSVDFSTSDHAAIAGAYGIRGLRVDDPSCLSTTLAEALAHDGPTLVDVVVQPLEQSRAPVSKWIA